MWGAVIYRLYKELRNTYDGTISMQYSKQFSNNIIDSGDINKLNDFVKQVIINRELSFLYVDLKMLLAQL